MKLKKNHVLRGLLLVILIILPWSNSNYLDDKIPPQPSQEDLTFYEVNVCSVSFVEFLLNNPNTIYQNHYQFRTNELSSISCFGKISGLTEIDSTFYISIGTNSLVNFILQTLFWTILLSYIPRKKEILKKNTIMKYLAILCATYLFTFSIYAEKRFYENKIFGLNLDERNTYFYLFLYFFPIIFIFISMFLPRLHESINLIPILFLLNFVFSGFNTSLILVITSYFGFYSIFTRSANKMLLKIYVLFTSIWLLNSTSRFSFYPSKLRGFTSSSYDLNSTILWSINFLLIIITVAFLVKNLKKQIDIYKMTKNIVSASYLILTISYIASNIPLFNFLSYYYLGLQRYGVTIQNPFLRDEFGLKVSWRGIFPSAETLGEFFGIGLLFLIFLYFHNYLKLSEFIFYTFPLLLGLYFTNNRTSSLLVFIAFLYYVSKNYKFNKKQLLIISSAFLFLLVFIIGYQNFTWSYDASSSLIYLNSISYSKINGTSSFFNFLTDNFSNNTFTWKSFGFFGYLGFLINRSELWGIFFARYNPTFLEIIFGSGPLNFGQLYGEISIKQTSSLLLPHSSMLSYLLFFGIGGIVLIALYVTYKTLVNKKYFTFIEYFFGIYILFNIIKNDSLNYLSVMIFYYFIAYFILNKKNYSFNRFVRKETIK
tara:strand:+ start:7168 stop:9129 length:1962 start_codon:yes stop_codon:yes gene_type:complete